MGTLQKLHIPQTLGCLVLCLTGFALWGWGKAVADDDEPNSVTATSHRIVAVGDLHADLPHTIQTLQMAGIIDRDGHWNGGTTTLVQTGDITDRGPDSLEVITLIRQLQQEAAEAGGAVHPLLGNHEVMNLMGDWRYVSDEDVQDFGSVAARREAFGLKGELGAWLAQLDAVKQIDGNLFLPEA